MKRATITLTEREQQRAWVLNRAGSGGLTGRGTAKVLLLAATYSKESVAAQQGRAMTSLYQEAGLFGVGVARWPGWD